MLRIITKAFMHKVFKMTIQIVLYAKYQQVAALRHSICARHHHYHHPTHHQMIQKNYRSAKLCTIWCHPPDASAGSNFRHHYRTKKVFSTETSADKFGGCLTFWGVRRQSVVRTARVYVSAGE